MGLALPCGFVDSVGRRQAQSGHFILSAAPTVLDVRPSALPAATAGARLGAALGLGAAIAFALLLEDPAQTLVWLTWAAEEVMEVWLCNFRDSLTESGRTAADI